jgi:hypothetical protein
VVFANNVQPFGHLIQMVSVLQSLINARLIQVYHALAALMVMFLLMVHASFLPLILLFLLMPVALNGIGITRLAFLALNFGSLRMEFASQFQVIAKLIIARADNA